MTDRDILDLPLGVIDRHRRADAWRYADRDPKLRGENLKAVRAQETGRRRDVVVDFPRDTPDGEWISAHEDDVIGNLEDAK